MVLDGLVELEWSGLFVDLCSGRWGFVVVTDVGLVVYLVGEAMVRFGSDIEWC